MNVYRLVSVVIQMKPASIRFCFRSATLGSNARRRNVSLWKLIYRSHVLPVKSAGFSSKQLTWNIGLIDSNFHPVYVLAILVFVYKNKVFIYITKQILTPVHKARVNSNVIFKKTHNYFFHILWPSLGSIWVRLIVYPCTQVGQYGKYYY